MISPVGGPPLAATRPGGRLGTLAPGAEAIRRIKPNGVDPQRNLAHLLTRLAEGWPPPADHEENRGPGDADHRTARRPRLESIPGP